MSIYNSIFAPVKTNNVICNKHKSMKKFFLLPLAFAAMGFASCSDEPLNAECDIESVTLGVETPEAVFYHAYDATQSVPSTADSIGFLIRHYVDVESIPVNLTVTPGATVYVVGADGTESLFKNGSSLDFSDEQIQRFHVVSQDGAWSRNYKLNVVHDIPSEGDMTLDFETFDLDASGKYYIWTVTDPNAVNGLFGLGDPTWKNGNPGFKLSKSSAKPMEYPSVPLAGEGPDGSACVKLETMDTGGFGQMVNMRMAAGSMFVGEFDVANALKDALKATRFGLPFKHKPVKFSAWLKYESGTKAFQDRLGKPVEGVTDEPDAYIVVYRNQDAEGNRVMLDGNDVLTSPYIVGVARLPHHYVNPEATNPRDGGGDLESNDPIHGVTNEWKQYVLDVNYYEDLDPEILANNGYSMVIGFACSWQGAYFRGSIGSKLYIDNVNVICEY